MKCIIKLSKKDIGLAKAEVLSLAKKEYGLIDDLLIADYVPGIENRLGYSHSIFEFLFLCDKNELHNEISVYNWQEKYSDNFCVRAHGLDEIELARSIFRRIDGAIVKLRNPKTRFEFFLKNGQVIAGKFISDIDKSYLTRKAHLRPSLHPTSMHPGLARACINLTGLTNGKLLDPFCGSGGILIEAGLMGFDAIGYDIDPLQIKRATVNMDHYGIKADLRIQDALKSDEQVDAIVTDIPYGKGSKVKDVQNLCDVFLMHANEQASILVLVAPDFIRLNARRWKLMRQFRVYIHKNLSRIITVLHCLR